MSLQSRLSCAPPELRRGTSVRSESWREKQSLSRGSASSTTMTDERVPLPPAPERRLQHARPLHDLDGAMTVRRRQHDPGPPDKLARCIVVAQQSLKLSAVGGAKLRPDVEASHPPCIPQRGAGKNPMSGAEHAATGGPRYFALHQSQQSCPASPPVHGGFPRSGNRQGRTQPIERIAPIQYMT